MADTDPEIETQKELRQDAAGAGDDPVTSREETEQELMAEGQSEAGEDLGDEMP